MAAPAESVSALSVRTTALGRLADLLCLETGWDGESAIAPSPLAVRNAIRFLVELPPGNTPDIGPGLDGSIEMEWELPERPMVSLTFEGSGTAYFTAFTPDRVLEEFECEVDGALTSAVVNILG